MFMDLFPFVSVIEKNDDLYERTRSRFNLSMKEVSEVMSLLKIYSWSLGCLCKRGDGLVRWAAWLRHFQLQVWSLGACSTSFMNQWFRQEFVAVMFKYLFCSILSNSWPAWLRICWSLRHVSHHRPLPSLPTRVKLMCF